MEHVKDQGACGSCYSFSATGAIETAHCVATGEMIDLSDKDCMDCSFRYKNKGCNGGWMAACFQYYEDNGKICYEEDYPYKPKYEVCQEKKCTEAHVLNAPISDHFMVPKNDAEQLMAAIDQHAVAVAVQANSEMFRFYSEGILVDGREDDEKCGTSLNHAVLAVGYNYSEENTSDNYVLIKNSWSGKWGDEGYIKLGFGDIKHGGTCGVFKDGTHPQA